MKTLSDATISNPENTEFFFELKIEIGSREAEIISFPQSQGAGRSCLKVDNSKEIDAGLPHITNYHGYRDGKFYYWDAADRKHKIFDSHSGTTESNSDRSYSSQFSKNRILYLSLSRDKRVVYLNKGKGETLAPTVILSSETLLQ